MSHSLSQVAATMQKVLTTRANVLARQEGFVRRQRKLSGATFAQILVFSWLANPRSTLEGMAQTSVACGLSIQPQSLEERFTDAAARFLRRLLEEAVGEVVAADPVATPLLQRFAGVYLLDSTRLALPETFAGLFPGNRSETAATVKVQLRWDVLSGAWDGLKLQAGREHDRSSQLQRKSLPPKALRIADLGYFSLDVLEELSAAEGFWLTRIQAGTGVYAYGQRWDLPTLLDKHGPAKVGQTWELPVELGIQKRISCRLLAIRVPSEVAGQRRARLQAEAKRRGQPLKRGQERLAEWTLLVTNAPLTPQEAEVLMRLRWQIERLFRLWKEQGALDESRSQKPERILCEFYAKLLALLIQHWALVTTTWRFPDRSLTQAAAFFRSHATHFASVFTSTREIQGILLLLQRYMQSGGRLQKRRTQPNHCQLLLAVT